MFSRWHSLIVSQTTNLIKRLCSLARDKLEWLDVGKLVRFHEVESLFSLFNDIITTL